ncbi:MAG: hypothetical protein DWQ10_00675, partial [Calditrichaeota bacterium]
RINSILLDSRNRTWFATRSNISYAKDFDFHNINSWDRLTSITGAPISKCYSLFEADNNYLWLGTERGLFYSHVDSAEKHQNWRRFAAQDTIFTEVGEIAQTRNGILLCATTDQGVIKISSHISQTWEKIAGLPDNRIASLFTDSFGDIWIATKGGAARFDQESEKVEEIFTQQNTNGGLPLNLVQAITRQNDNIYWFATTVGLVRLNRAVQPNEWHTFTTTNSGLLTNHTVSVFWNEPTETLFIGTFGGGLTKYTPSKFPPKTEILQDVDVVYGNEVTYRFSGSDQNSPTETLIYEYRLDSQSWITTNQNSATLYIDAAEQPALHLFEVRAIDPDGNRDPNIQSDTFYRLNPTYAGAVSDTNAQFKVTLTLAPNIHVDNTQKMIEFIVPALLEDQSTLVAVELTLPDSDQANAHSLAFAFPQETVNNIDANLLGIYKLEEDALKLVGGTLTQRNDSLQIETAVSMSGRYDLRAATGNDSGIENLKIIDIQPRVIHSRSPDKLFGGVAVISFDQPQAGQVSAYVYSASGKRERTIVNSQHLNQGRNVIKWDGRDENGEACSSGVYIVVIRNSQKIVKKSLLVVNNL